MTDRLLRIRDVCERTTLSRSSLYAKIRADEFPSGRRLGDGAAVRWLESDIVEWMRTRPEATLDDWMTPERKAELGEQRKAKLEEKRKAAAEGDAE